MYSGEDVIVFVFSRVSWISLFCVIFVKLDISDKVVSHVFSALQTW